jgi:hypothetical protein
LRFDVNPINNRFLAIAASGTKPNRDRSVDGLGGILAQRGLIERALPRARPARI